MKLEARWKRGSTVDSVKGVKIRRKVGKIRLREEIGYERG